jgi:hypothetical protein
MDTIVGLGNAGCNIADYLSQYPQYKIFKLDANLQEEEGNYSLPKLNTPEEYDALELDLEDFFQDASQEVLFVVAGSGLISNVSLNVLKALRSRRVSIMYIRPDLELLAPQSTPWLSERVVFNVLQEYTRSGVFEKMWIISNPEIEGILGDVPIIGYYDKLNDLIASTFHMMNVFWHSKPIIDTSYEVPKGCRIGTLGISNIKNQKKLFFPLDDVRDSDYIYSVSNEKLENDGSLLKKINKTMKEVNHRTSYGVYQTNYKDVYVYVEKLTQTIQN